MTRHSADPVSPSSDRHEPPLVLRHARLVGADRDLVDVTVSDGVVTRIEPTGRRADPGEETVDLDGRFLMRGLWDHHVHMGMWALHASRLDLSRTASAHEVATLVADHVRDRPRVADQPLVGVGFRDALWPDTPSTTALDAAAPDRPVVLVSNDLHCAWLNSAALLRYTGHVPSDPLLREDDFTPVLTQIQAVPEEHRTALIRDAAIAAARRGVVGIVELERAPNLSLWPTRVATGVDLVRVECGVYPEHLDAALGLGLATGEPVPGTHGLVTMGRLKIVVDGSLGTRTALCYEPYAGLAGTGREYGTATIAPAELTALVRRAWAAGVEAAIHAIGDRANTFALDAFEQVGCRGRVEHAQLLRSDDLARFGRLGITASIQPSHAIDDRDIADHHWAGRTDRAFPFADLAAVGTPLVLGSDAPVAPLDPWHTIAAAVHRSDDDRPPWHPEQQLGRTIALDASTNGGAAVRAGMVADLAVLEADPVTATPAQLRAMPVHATLLEGRWTWRAA